MRGFLQTGMSCLQAVRNAVNFYRISLKVMRCRFVRPSFLSASGTAICGQVSRILSVEVRYSYKTGPSLPRKAYEREGFDRAFYSFWHPRTAVGKKADGTLLFVTITATERGVRRGVMLPRLAELFLEWGATDALNLDGGNSSMLVIRDEVVSIKKKDATRDKSEGQKAHVEQKARFEKNMKTARGNRRIRPMPKQQGRAISDAILIFSRF